MPNFTTRLPIFIYCFEKLAITHEIPGPGDLFFQYDGHVLALMGESP